LGFGLLWVLFIIKDIYGNMSKKILFFYKYKNKKCIKISNTNIILSMINTVIRALMSKKK
jgi:hypothetical protein